MYDFNSYINNSISNFYQTSKTYSDTFMKTINDTVVKSFDVTELQKRFETVPQVVEHFSKVATEATERNGEFFVGYVQKSMDHIRVQAEKVIEESSKIFKQ